MSEWERRLIRIQSELIELKGEAPTEKLAMMLDSVCERIQEILWKVK